MAEQPQQENVFKKAWHAIKPSKRIEDSEDNLKRLGGLIPVYNIRDLEQRRGEVAAILETVEGKALTDEMEKATIDKVFRLFALSGSPWYRGLDNRDLSSRAASFLWLYNEYGDSAAFRRTLFMCCMQLLHLSFQAIDVTNTPPYLIQSTPVIIPNNPTRIDMSGGVGNGAGPEGREQRKRKTEDL